MNQKEKTIALLKSKGFNRVDENSYANNSCCFSFNNGSISVVNNDGDYLCNGLPINHYAVFGFLCAKLGYWSPIKY